MAKAVIRPEELENRAGFSDAQLRVLIEDLGRLGESDVDVARKAVRWVADGEGEDAVAAVAGLEKAGEHLGFSHPNLGMPGAIQRMLWLASRKNPRELLLKSPGDVDPAAWVRLARVWSAAAGSGRGLGTPRGWPAWWFLLRQELAGAGARWPVGVVEAALRSEEEDPDIPLRMLLEDEGSGGVIYGPMVPSQAFRGWDAYLGERTPAIRAVLALDGAEELCEAVDRLVNADYGFGPVLDRLAELATDHRKTVRESVGIPVDARKEELRPLLESILELGPAASREQAVRLLHRHWGEDVADLLRRRGEEDSSSRVRKTVELLLAPAGETPRAEASGPSMEIPPEVPVELGRIPLPASLPELFTERIRRRFEREMRSYERALERYRRETAENRGRPKDEQTWTWKPQKPTAVARQVADRVFEYVESGEGKPPTALFLELPDVRSPGLRLAHVVRLDLALSQLRLDGLHWDTTRLDAFRRASPEPRFGLRELARVLAEMGVSAAALGTKVLDERWGWSEFLSDWEDDAIWPFFAENPEILRAGLHPKSRDEVWLYGGDRRTAAVRILAMFPSPPPEFLETLWEMALGEAKTLRPWAQEALAGVDGKTERILVALGDGKQAVRAAAAEWLGRLGDPSALAPLKEAFEKEKQELVKGAILAALETLGADLDELFDRKSLAAEAKKGLAKKLPKGMEWFPLDALPRLHWADDGSEVEPDLVRWWVVQAVRCKSPVPGPLLRRTLALCRKDETASLARFVLSAWIAHDTHTLSREEAEAKASSLAASQWNPSSVWLQRNFGSQQGLYEHYVRHFQGELLGSAIGQKGVLAIAAAAGDREVARSAERYIRRWYGQRLAQCKALLEVLAWCDDPLGVQVLLSIANRFRTASIRKAADEYVRELAEREGWTLDELADRTVPDGGFERETDEEGRPVGSDAVLVLDYGARTFTVRLDDGLVPVIVRDDGRRVKTLPKPAKGDDPEAAKEARKRFNTAKKTVRDVVQRQSERLYEAMCVQRTWRFEDWRRDLADHPIVGKLVTRLVWEVVDPENTTEDGAAPQVQARFRPLEDGSLTDVGDEEVAVDLEARIRLAHAATTPQEETQSWVAHFEDYDVEPLFVQFAAEVFELPDSDGDSTELFHRQGWMVSTFQLRGRATKRGWIRGQAEDGGVFHHYRKPFPSLGLQAVLEFSGSYAMEEDMPAALFGLHFVRMKGTGDEIEWRSEKVPLRRIPPVLLSECANDVAVIAEAGTGFDPDWESKGYF